jgi:hypothetical protein
LAQHEFGLEVITRVGRLRHRGHRSVPEIHSALCELGVEISERSVTNLLDRYDELLATSLTAVGACAGCWPDGAGLSWHWTACSRTWVTRCCGWSATASRARYCWPSVTSPH